MAGELLKGHYRWEIQKRMSHIALKVKISCSVMSDSATPWTVHRILQGRILERVPRIFMAQGSNLDLLHHRQILYCLSHKRSYIALAYSKYLVFS